MPQVNCKICKTEFYAKPSWLKQGWGIFCSRLCLYQGRRKGKIIKCFICGKESYKQPKALNKSKSKKYFCGKSCQTTWRNSVFIGNKHANWKNGNSAYRTILTRNGIPKICRLCNTDDKRILAVHHIDHNRGNNKVNNLTWLCHNCHFLVHHHDQECKKLNMVPIA